MMEMIIITINLNARKHKHSFLVNVHTLIKHTIQSDIYSNKQLICCSTILFLSHQHVNPF